MVLKEQDKKLVVVQLNGGNDALNTVVPINEGLYYDNRPHVHIIVHTVIIATVAIQSFHMPK